MRVYNPVRSPAKTRGCDTAPIPPGYAQIVGDQFPICIGDATGAVPELGEVSVSE